MCRVGNTRLVILLYMFIKLLSVISRPTLNLVWCKMWGGEEHIWRVIDDQATHEARDQIQNTDVLDL